MPQRRIQNLEPVAVNLSSTRDLLVLLLLTEGPQHGAEIVARLREVTWSPDLPDTTVYQNLRRLKRLKYAVKGIVRPGAPGNSKNYEITHLGRMVLESYLGVLASAGLDGPEVRSPTGTAGRAAGPGKRATSGSGGAEDVGTARMGTVASYRSRELVT